MNQEKVSVIMPVKNEELFIEATVESILEQRYPHFELLICDDNSTDRTNEILKKIEAKDQRIRLFENTGKGIIDALKILEDNITSNWITRMDGDDLMPKYKLERFMERRREGVMVTGMVEYFSDKPISDGYVSYQNWLNQRVVSQDYGIHKYRECVVASANWLMSADTLRSIGGLTNNCYPEDYDLVLRALLHGLTIEGVPEVTHLWREYPERTSRLSPDYNQDSFFKMKALYIAKEHRGKSIAYFGGGIKQKLFKEYFTLPFNTYGLKENPLRGIQHFTAVNEQILLIGVYPEKEERLKLEKFISQKGFTLGENAFYL